MHASVVASCRGIASCLCLWRGRGALACEHVSSSLCVAARATFFEAEARHELFGVDMLSPVLVLGLHVVREMLRLQIACKGNLGSEVLEVAVPGYALEARGAARAIRSNMGQPTREHTGTEHNTHRSQDQIKYLAIISLTRDANWADVSPSRRYCGGR